MANRKYNGINFNIIRFTILLLIMVGGVLLIPPKVNIANAESSITVTFPNMDGIKFYKGYDNTKGFNEDVTGSSISIDQIEKDSAGQYVFYAEVDIASGYDPSNVKITSKWQELTQTYIQGASNKYKCTIPEIKTSTSIIVNGLRLKNFNVILPKKISGISNLQYYEKVGDKSTDYTGGTNTDDLNEYIAKGSVAGSDSITVNYNTSFKFYLRLKDKGYTNNVTKKDFNIKVFEQAKEIKTDKDGKEYEGDYITDENWYLDANNKAVLLGTLNFSGNENGFLSSKYTLNDNVNYENDKEVDWTKDYSERESKRKIIFIVDGIKKDQHTISLEIPSDIPDGNVWLENVSFISNGENISVQKIEMNKGILTIESDSKKPDYNTYVDFEVKLSEGYDQSWPKISGKRTDNSINFDEENITNFDVTPISKGKYRMNSLGCTKLTVNNINKNTYKITLPTISGLSFDVGKITSGSSIKDNDKYQVTDYESISNGYKMVEYGDKLGIKVYVDSVDVGIDIDTVQIKVKSKDDSTADKKLTVLNKNYDDNYIEFVCETPITQDEEIIGSASKIKYDMELSLSSDTEGLSSGETIDPNIVKFYDAYGTQIVDKTRKVEHGTSFQFSIDINHKYSQSATSNVKVYYISFDGEEQLLSLNNGSYTVPTVKGGKNNDKWLAVKIEVRNLKVNTYNLTFINTDEVKFYAVGDNVDKDYISKVVVKYGDTYSFNLKLSYGYSMENSRVTANDVAMRMKDNKYVIEEITEDTTIEVQDISKVKYTVTFPTEIRGITFEDTSGYEINKANVTYKDSYSFKIDVDSKYSQIKDTIKVYAVPLSKINNESSYSPESEYLITKDSGEQYKINSVEEEMKVFVEGVVKNTYVVNLPVTESELIFTVNGEIVTESNMEIIDEVEHGENFRFEILKDNIGILSSNNKYVYDENNEKIISSKEYNKDGDLLYNNTYNYNSNGNISLIEKANKDGTEASKIEYVYEGNILKSIKETKQGVAFYEVTYTYDGNEIISYVKKDLINNTILNGSYNYKGDKLISIKETDENGILKTTYWYSYSGDKVVSERIYSGNTSYDISDIEFSGATVEPVNNGYIIQGVSSDLDITVKGVELRLYNVYFDSDEVKFYESASSTAEIKTGQVKHGTDVFEFVVSINDAYKLSGDKLVLEVSNASNDEAATAKIIEPNNSTDTYKLTNVSEDVKITVSGLEIKKYNVYLPTNTEGIEFRASNNGKLLPDVNNIEYGSDFQFEVREKYGYDISSITITQNDNTVYPSYGIYKITNITSDTNVSVTGVGLSKYTLKLRGDNLTFYDKSGTVPTNNADIEYVKGTFEFKLAANTGYNISDGVEFYNYIVSEDSKFVEEEIVLNDTSNDNQVHITGPNESGVYTISNVQERTIIQVKGAKKNIYKLTFPNDVAGIKIKDAGNKELPTQNDVKYLSEFNFVIEPENGYNVSNVKVEVEPYGSALIQNIDGGYKVYQIIDSVNIKISGIELNNYDIPLKGTGADFYNSGGTQISSITIQHGKQGEFSLKEQSGYKLANGYTLALEDEDNIEENALIKVGINSQVCSYDSDGDTVSIYETLNDSGNTERTLEIEMASNDIYIKYDSDGNVIDDEYDISKISINEVDGKINTITNLNSNKTFTLGYDGAGQLVTVTSSKSEWVIGFGDNKYSVYLKNGTQIKQTGSNTYALANVQSESIVEIQNVGKEQYYISLPVSMEGITFHDSNGQEIQDGTVNHGDSFSFSIMAEKGYSIKNISVTANSLPLELKDGIYTINNIDSDITVSVEGVAKDKIKLSFKYVTGVIYKDVNDNEISTIESLDINSGDDYKFKISLSDAYTQASDTINVVTDNSESPISFERGIYTISNLTKDTVVNVEGVNINQYNVTLTEADGINYMNQYGTEPISGIQKVKYGENFKFMLSAKEGYDISGISVMLKVDGKEKVKISDVDSIYTIENLTANCTIVIENVVKSKYTVEIKTLTGVSCLDLSGNSLASRLTIEHGGSVSFTLSLDSAYNASQPIVMVKGRTQSVAPENGVYTISDIKENTIVEVSGITKNTYTIYLKAAEGVIYKNARNKEIKDKYEVEWNGTFTFKISLMDAYDASTPVVMVDEKQTLVENGGVYQLANVTGDRTITVKNVTLNPEEGVISRVIELPDEIKTLSDAYQVVEAAQSYLALTEEEQALVTNVNDLVNAQELAGDIFHTSNGITVGGIDWYVQVIVEPQDEDAIAELSEEVKRKNILSLYNVRLVDTLSGGDCVLPDDTKVTVVMPAIQLEGYKSEVIVHEISDDNIEYLDLIENDGQVYFETSSFGSFGIAAKKIPNYTKRSSDLTISVKSIADNATIQKVLADEDIFSPSIDSNSDGTISTGGSSNKSNMAEGTSNFFVNLYNWALEHELIATIIIIALFSTWIIIVVVRSKKKA